MHLIIESVAPRLDEYLHTFCTFVCDKLGILTCPPLSFVEKTGHSSFGSYHPSKGTVIVATGGRHVADILRTLAHELVHDAQITQNSPLDLEGLEYEANAISGMLLRDWNRAHPELYGATEPGVGSDEEGESQGVTFPDTTRPSGPIEFVEEMTAGAGDVAGIGIGPQGEPPVRKSRMLRRVPKTLKQFVGRT
jgi:hypothetical protein